MHQNYFEKMLKLVATIIVLCCKRVHNNKRVLLHMVSTTISGSMTSAIRGISSSESVELVQVDMIYTHRWGDKGSFSAPNIHCAPTSGGTLNKAHYERMQHFSGLVPVQC